MPDSLPAFRLGDVRGIYPSDLDESFAQRFAHAFVQHFGLSGRIATGRDMRESSVGLQTALNQGLQEAGMNVVDIGLCTTELGYYASTLDDIEACIIVTASHNPARYNGFKCVLRHGEAVTFETGLQDVMRLMLRGQRCNAGISPGSYQALNLQPRYIEFLRRQFVSRQHYRGKIALNGLNGTAATLAETLACELELPVTWFRKEPGPIPEEGCDPVKPRIQQEMRSFMQRDFSLGVAWDGDCDRCVFFDESGEFIPTYYIIGILAEHYLQRFPGASIVFDSKLFWNTVDIIQRYGGKAVVSETGHAFMKSHMRKHNAIYGGELSAHHYFGDFFGCDSGMFTWLKLVEILQNSACSVAEIIDQRRKIVCCTPELSLLLNDADRAFAELLKRHQSTAVHIDYFDGLSFEMPGDWRFSLRKSKTEPLVRLNFEARGNSDMLLNKAADVLQQLKPFSASDADWQTGLKIQ